MAKQLNVNLAMTADTSQAKLQLQQLQRSLTELVNLSNNRASEGFGITKEIQEASAAAAQLKVQLKAATDVNTGKLDLSKFSQQLDQSGMNLTKYQTQLTALGPAGEKAFAALATSISNADARISNANSALSQFAVTLKNTARWQISSSVLHGFMGTIQSAYGYAQDLNESLNNIRIVTGQSSDQMAVFAEKANKAAQALNTTTTSYTDAALIFYQQGLNGKEVEERTNAVIKMAQVTGDSATEVSSYMTAIWNNFDDGSESLEHYADVITALGASTASSSAEIAAGLEKFASVAETIGLSYDYSTAALATIVANTRQSADTIGTGLRTIFSRLQGLTLGETLDDGTDLNKYSKALKTVGVDILDASGNMKNMDTILTDLAEKWDNLSKAQQTALAQTVGGVRQYTNLIALMNNWDDMETNLQTAAGSNGSLQNQADIYAESWEAAQKRVKASAEAIYNALLNDDFFIDLNNGFSGFLDIINNTIKGLGGLKGVLLTVGTIITQVYQKEISGMIGSLGTQLMMLTKTGKQHVEDLRREANEKLINNAYNDGTTAGAAKAAGYTAQGAAQQAFLDNAKKMSEEQRNIAQILLDQNKALSEAVIKQSELAKETEKEAVSQKRIFELKTGLGKSDKIDDATNKAKRAGRLANADKALASSAESINFDNINDPRNKSAIKELQASISSLQRGYQDLGMTAKEALGEKAGSALNRMASAFDKDGNLIKSKVEELRQGWAQWTEAFSQGDTDYETALNNLAEAMSGVSAKSIELGTATDAEVAKFNACKEKAREMTQQFYQAGQAESHMAGKTGELSNYVDGLKQKFKEMSQSSIGMSTALTQISSTLMSAGMAINSVIGLIQVWKDEDADLTTQLLTTLTTLGMIVPTIMSVVKGFGTAGQAVTIFGVQTSLAMWQVTLIVAAIAGLIAIFAILANAAYKASPEGVFKSAAKAADEAKDAADQVKESYDNLIDSLQSLDDGIEAIEEMTRGTLEWRQAIAESNASLIELLQTYGMLDSANFTTDADGLMHLTDKAREEMTQNAINAVNEANMASYGAQVFANNASSRNQASNAADDLTVWRDSGNGPYDVLSSNSQLSADVGMAIAKALNSGALTDLNNTSQIENALSSIKGLTDAEKESVARQIAASGELQASMQELSGVVAANTAANDVLNNQIINGKYGDQIANSGLDENSQAAVSKMAGDQLESLAEDLYNKTYKDKGALGGGMTDAEVQKLYAEAMGWATDTIDNQSGNKAKYYAKDGKEIGVISDEVARKYLAQQSALEQLGENVQGYIQNVETMVSQGDQIAEGVGNALLSFAGGVGGSFQELTQGELSAVRNSLSAETDENGNLTSDTFNIGDITVDTAYAQSLGYESVQAYYDAIQNALSSSEETFDIAKLTESWGLEDINGKILNTAGDRLNNLFSENGSLDLSQMTAGAVKTFADGYRKIYEEGGSEALDVVDSLLAASGDKADEVASLMGDVDWSNWDSIQGLSSDIQALGVEFDTGLIDQLANATGAVRSFNTEEFVKEISNIQDIISGLSTGDTISAEDYAQLGEGYESFFTLMADGTYKLTGDAEKFYNVVSQNQRSELLKTLQAGKSDLEAAQARQAAATSAMGTQDASTIGNLNLNTENNTYNTRTSQEQLDFIKEMGAATEDQIAVWEAALKDANGDWQSVNVSVLQEISDVATAATADFNALDSQIEANNQTLLETQQALFTTATSLEELDMAVYQVDQVMGEHDYNAYAAGLMNIASQYENCTTELVAYNEALASGTIEQIKAAESALKLQVEIGELSEKYGLDANEVSSYAKRLAKSFEEAGMSQEEAAAAAKTAAVNNTRLDRGLINLNKNLDDYKKSLAAANKGTAEWSRAMDELKDDLADILGMDASTLTDTFGEAALNSEDLTLALDGNIDAIKRLQEAAAQEMILDIKANLPENEVSNFMSQWDYLKANMATAIESPGVDQTNLIASFNEMIRAGNMTKEQIETALAGLHVSANVKTTYISQKQQVPLTITETSWLPSGTMTVPIPDGNGGTRNETYTSMRRVTKTYDAGVDEADVVVPQYEIEGTKGSGNSTVAFTAAPTPRASRSSTTSGGAGGSGGGGGSSSAPKYNEEKHKNTNDEKERYHVIKNQLEDLSSQYENISKAKDKAFGAARLANLNKEISAQKKLTQANKEYLSEIEKYLAEDKAAVKALGADIDANGTITNYDALVQKAVSDYNAAVDAFNRATTDDEGAQKAFEAAQERYDKFMETISQYEETQDLYKEQMQQVLDDIMTEQSLLLERTQLEVELKINVSEDALEYLEYMMDNIENKAYDCAEAFGYLNGMTQEYFKTAEALEGGLRSLFANQGLTDADFQKLIEGDTATYNKLMDMLSSGGTADLSDGLQQSEIDTAYGFTADDVDTMRDYVSQLIEANQNLQEIRQTVHEQILNVWDEWNEKLDAGIAKIEHLQSITESYQNIIDIVGQKNLGVSNAFMSKMRQQSIDQANDKLEAEKARYESLKKARDDAYAKFEEQKSKGILSPEEIKQWEDSLAQMDEDVQSASEDFQSAWEDALTAANEAFETAVDQIMQAYDDAAAGLMGSMSDLQDAFDRKSDLSSQYLADYEKIYQLTKLNRDLENSIDSTNNTKAKAELLELQSKINAYEEAGIDISEYQMEQLRQEYELKKAQIELEESQEAKSQVQMTRDADGNYSYVYTANADDVAKAEQNYEDKLHQMQESNANYINDLQSNMIQMEQDYQDKVQEIMKDTSLTAEERMVKLNELNQYYDEKMKFYMSEAELWEENSQRLYEEDWMNYAAATGYKISSEEEWLDHWNETQLSILTGFGSLEEYQTNHNMNVANLLLSSSDAFATWQTNIETAMQNAGTSMGTFQEDATEVLNTVAEESEETKDSVVDMAETAADKIGEVVEAVVDWENQYSATVQKMLTWNNALITSFNKLIAGWSAVQSSANSSGAGSGDSSSSGSGSGSGSGSSSSNNGSNSGSSGGDSVDNSDKVAGVAAAIWMDGASASGWGNNPTRATRLKEKGVEGAQAYINAHGANGDIYADWANKRNQLRNYYYGSFDTGGYTGEWGLDGKFAMLHEKELVLNKDDTTHFLQAIDIVRQISELIDLNALSSAGGLSSLLAATASSSSQKLEQQVTIHAEFPNVTDKDQITEAFTDLVNLASQYANRK